MHHDSLPSSVQTSHSSGRVVGTWVETRDSVPADARRRRAAAARRPSKSTDLVKFSRRCQIVTATMAKVTEALSQTRMRFSLPESVIVIGMTRPDEQAGANRHAIAQGATYIGHPELTVSQSEISEDRSLRI